VDALARAYRDKCRRVALDLALAFHSPEKLSEPQDEAEEDAQGLSNLLRWGSALSQQLNDENE
jgi:hypothetical protein